MGIKINGAKFKIISPSRASIVIDGQEVEHVEDFVFLGSVVPSSGADVKRRTALASSAFGRLKKAIWSKRSISLQLKSLYRALILSIATYASETWTLKSEDVRKLEVFERRCLSRPGARSCNLSWPSPHRSDKPHSMYQKFKSLLIY